MALPEQFRRQSAAYRESVRRRWRVALMFALFLGLAGLSYGTYLLVRKDPQIAKVESLQKELFASTEGSTPLTDEQRRERFRQFREEIEKLTPEQRRSMFENSPYSPRQQMKKRLEEYHALPQSERKAYLDKEIDRMERGRREWSQRRSQTAGSASPGGPQRPERTGNPPTGTRDRSAMGSSSSGGGASAPSANSQASGGRGPGPGWQGQGPGRSPEARENRKRDRLDSSTPEERAMMTAYIRDLNARRQERGLPPMRGPGR